MAETFCDYLTCSTDNFNIGLFFVFSMHRDERSLVGALEPRHPLPESSRSVHELYLRRRKPRADMAPERNSRPVLSEVHQGGDRVRAYLTRQREAHSSTSAADHTRTDALQAQRERRRVRAHGHHVLGLHAGAAGPPRRAPR